MEFDDWWRIDISRQPRQHCPQRHATKFVGSSRIAAMKLLLRNKGPTHTFWVVETNCLHLLSYLWIGSMVENVRMAAAETSWFGTTMATTFLDERCAWYEAIMDSGYSRTNDTFQMLLYDCRMGIELGSSIAKSSTISSTEVKKLSHSSIGSS